MHMNLPLRCAMHHQCALEATPVRFTFEGVVWQAGNAASRMAAQGPQTRKRAMAADVMAADDSNTRKNKERKNERPYDCGL